MWWLHVGAGGHVARRTSAWWERATAARQHRPPQVLVHAVLEVEDDDGVVAVDMGPTWGKEAAAARRVLMVGPVGSPALGWCPFFRYELRVVPSGVDESAVVASSARVSLPAGVLDDLAHVPGYTWGRDEAAVGDMWTSNSVVAWLLARAGVNEVAPPPGHRAPGWAAGTVVARR